MVEEWRASFNKGGLGKGHTKYHNEPAVYNGTRYPSKAQADYAALLDIRVKAGDPERWWPGEQWVLQEGPRRVRITYTPDFECFSEPGHHWVVDVKGGPTATPVFRLKAKLWLVKYPTIPLVVARRHRDGTWEEHPL